MFEVSPADGADDPCRKGAPLRTNHNQGMASSSERGNGWFRLRDALRAESSEIAFPNPADGAPAQDWVVVSNSPPEPVAYMAMLALTIYTFRTGSGRFEKLQNPSPVLLGKY